MTNWTFKNITDYWDQNKDAIFSHSAEIDRSTAEMKNSIFTSIELAIKDFEKSASDKEMALQAFVMTEDIYKAANRDVVSFGETAFKYLSASAGTFCHLLSKRGFSIHYLVDNTYEQSAWGMTKPFRIYEPWFNAVGFVYICPQKIALDMMQPNDLDQYFVRLPQYIREARDLADALIMRCHEQQRHYMLLDTDYDPELFKKAEAEATRPLTLTIFRNEAPVKGSSTQVRCLDKEGRSFFEEFKK